MSSVQNLRPPLTERKTGGRQGLDGWVGGKTGGETEEGGYEGEMLNVGEMQHFPPKDIGLALHKRVMYCNVIEHLYSAAQNQLCLGQRTGKS